MGPTAATAGSAQLAPAIRDFTRAVRTANEEAASLGAVDKQLAVHALADLANKAADQLTSSPTAHPLPETADARELGRSLTRQDVLRSDGIFMKAAGKLAPHISILAVGAFLIAAGESLGKAALAVLLVGGTGAIALIRVGPAAARATASFVDELFNEPVAVKKLLREHVDVAETRLYGELRRARPSRAVEAIGPIGAGLVVVGLLLAGIGVAQGVSKEAKKSGLTPTYTVPTSPTITVPTDDSSPLGP